MSADSAHGVSLQSRERHCVAMCLARHFDFPALCRRYDSAAGITRFRDCLHLQEDGGGEVFIFDYGVVVLWDIDGKRQRVLVRSLQDFSLEAFAEPYQDSFSFSTGAPVARVQGDHIDLPDDDVTGKQAFSHAMAQSVKLQEFEASAESTITETQHIPRNMALTGSCKLGRRKIARMRGHLFLVQSDINLQYALLDTPEFFWEHPKVEDRYLMLRSYLEVEARIGLLERKLGVIHDIFGMLADEQKHRHSSFLEWMIIWLIAIDIVLITLHDILGWF